MMFRFILPLLAVLAAFPAELWAQSSGLPLPRFVSLRSDEINLRTGPGTRYPVDWVYKKRDLPVEIIAEFETWRRIRDWKGAEGWVHQGMLSSKRMLIVTGAARNLRVEPTDGDNTLAMVSPDVIGKILTCPRSNNYCRVDIGGIQGWLKRGDFWGIYAQEFIE